MKDEPCIGHVNVVVFTSITITEIRLKSDSQTLHRKHSYQCYNPDVAVSVIKNPISISGNRMDKSNYSIFLLQYR